MQYKLDKEAFDALPEEIQKEYKLDGDTATLNIEGDDAPTLDKIASLEKKRNIEAEHRANAEKKVKEANERAESLQKDLESAGGNKAELEKVREDFAKQMEELKEEREVESKQMRADRDRALIMETANKLASEHFTVPTLIAPEIAKRLTVIEAEGQQAVRALTADGKESLSNVSEMFKTDFLDNKDLSSITLANVGKGGGATPNNGSGAAGNKISEMDADSLVAFKKENPEQYAAQATAE